MTNGQNVARSRHLEELARAAKRYTLQEILDVTEAIAAELGGLSSPTYEDFTGATSIAGGVSGLVPAPSAGDEFKFLRGDGVWAVVESGGSSYVDFTGATSIAGGLSGLVPAPEAGDEAKFLRGDGSWATVKSGGSSIAVFTGATTDNGTSGLVPAPRAGDNGKFLRGDGVWATVESGSAGGAVDYVIGSKVSSVEGGFWQDTFNDTPVLKLRHGDYEYNFVYDNITYLGGASAPLVTVTPDTYVLGTASVSNDGGVWYEVNNDIPTLNLHKGNFNYSFNYDRITYRGDNSNLAAYLPFNVSPTADACGNTWTPMGNPTIVDGALYLDGSSYLKLPTITPTYVFVFTVDFWFTPSNISRDYCLFGSPNGYNLCVSAADSTLRLVYDGTERAKGQIAITPGTRHHIAYVGLQNAHALVFVDGVLDCDVEFGIMLSVTYWLGAGQNGEKPAIGSIDHFRVFRGQALWTTDFTPPTAEDYM